MDLVENSDVEYYFDIPVAVHEEAIILEFKQEPDLEFDKEYPLLVEQDVPEHFLLNAGKSPKEEPSWITTEETSAPSPTAKGKKKTKRKVDKAGGGRKLDQESSECEVCHSLFKNKDELLVHWQTHISYKCCQCHSLYPSMAALTDHAAVHDNDEHSFYAARKSCVHMCSTCGETFPRPSLLVEHEYIHSGNPAPLYICEYCPYTNRLRARLSLHRRRRHGVPGDTVRYDCDLCGRTFNNKYSMRAHMERHLQERTYVCHVCSKAFLTKSTLNGHVAIHSRDPTEKPHKCIICMKSYYKMPGLRQHMLSHTKEKPFVCEQCEPNRGFSSKFALKHHCLKYHHNEGCYP